MEEEIQIRGKCLKKAYLNQILLTTCEMWYELLPRERVQKILIYGI